MKAINKNTIKVTASAIILSLVSSAIYDLIRSQPLLSSVGSALKFLWLQSITLLNLNVKVYWALTIILTILAIAYFLLNKKRDRLSKTKIGHYTFKELHRIMRTEHINESNSVLVWRDYSQFSILEVLEAFHSRLGAGINLESDLFLYHDFCPRLYFFGLMDRKDEQHRNPDIITHHYTFNDNGKLFWAILNKLSIKQRLKTEKTNELLSKLQKGAIPPLKEPKLK